MEIDKGLLGVRLGHLRFPCFHREIWKKKQRIGQNDENWEKLRRGRITVKLQLGLGFRWREIGDEQDGERMRLLWEWGGLYRTVNWRDTWGFGRDSKFWGEIERRNDRTDGFLTRGWHDYLTECGLSFWSTKVNTNMMMRGFTSRISFVLFGRKKTKL